MRHLRRAFPLTGLALLWACGPAGAAELSPKDLFAKVAPAVLKIYQFDPIGKQFGVGSGFVVKSPGLVVTNYHVIESALTTANLRVEIGGELRKVKGISSLMPKHDLALLVVATKPADKLAALALAAKMPAQGEKAYTIGYPLGLPNATISDGLVNGFQKLTDLTLLQTSAPISEGSSGGPLLVADGTVVGVTTCSLVEGQNLNFAVPVEHVRRLLAAAGKLRQDIPRVIRAEALAAVTPVERPVSLAVPVNLADLRVPMTPRRLYTGMVQAYIVLGLARPNLPKEQQQELFRKYVALLSKQKIIARRTTCSVQVLRLQAGCDRAHSLRYVQRFITQNNDPRLAALCRSQLARPERYSVLAVCKSPYWPQTISAYVDKTHAARLARAKLPAPARITGFISRWLAIPGRKLQLSLTLDACILETAAPRRR